MKINDFLSTKGIQPAPTVQKGEQIAPTGLGEMKLSPGQLFKATVLLSQDGKVMLDIDGRMIAATSRVLLDTGREIWLEVKQGGETPWFALAGKKGVALEFMKLLLSESANIGKANEALTAFSATPGGMPSEIIDRFGSFMKWFAGVPITERPDPNAILGSLALMQSVGGGKTVELFPSDLQERLARLSDAGPLLSLQIGKDSRNFDQLLKMLDLLNAFNSHAVSDKQPAYLFPCFFSAGAGWGEWMFSADTDGGRDENGAMLGYTLDFYLHMSRLGEVEVHIAASKGRMLGEIRLGGKEQADHIKAMLPELESSLQSLGFERVQLRSVPRQGNMLQNIKESISEKVGLESSSLLDIRA